SIFFFDKVEKEFTPETDEGIFTITFRTPLGSSIDYTNSRLRLIEEVLASYPSEIVSYFATIGAGQEGQVNRGFISVRLYDRADRDMSQKALMRALRQRFDDIPGVRAFPAAVSIVRGQRSER